MYVYLPKQRFKSLNLDRLTVFGAAKMVCVRMVGGTDEAKVEVDKCRYVEQPMMIGPGDEIHCIDRRLIVGLQLRYSCPAARG